ncbi:hypothetical protein HB364_28945 [Pseudoflavitalea sp. X16]|nr:hypothetical protein [Paraflavitalea devenefica]
MSGLLFIFWKPGREVSGFGFGVSGSLVRRADERQPDLAPGRRKRAGFFQILTLMNSKKEDICGFATNVSCYKNI